jgi:hypothetical protein
MLKRIGFPLTLLGLACICIAVHYRAGLVVQNAWFSSDGMYLPVLFADLFAHGGRLKDWYLTPAPYFFPDYLIYATAYAASSGTLRQFLVFGLLQLVATTAAIAWLGRSCIREHATAAAVLVATCFGWLAMRTVEPYIYVLASGFHFGAFLATLAFVAVWLQREQQPARWQLAGMCALTFLTTLSDMLFVVQTIVPFLLASALVRRADRPFRARAALPHLAILLAAVLGSVAYKWVVSHRTRYPAKIGLDTLWPNLHALWDTVAQLSGQVPLLGLVMGVYLAGALVALVRIVQTRGFLGLPRPLLLLLTFSLFAVLCNLGFFLLVTNVVVNQRYMIAAASWPIIVTVLLLGHWRTTWFGTASLALTAALVTLLGIDAWHAPPQNDTAPRAWREDIACIDQALAASDARHGIAGYWDAKRIQAFSGRRLFIAQYLSDLSEHRWITSGAYFRPTYDFAIISAEWGPEFLLPMDALLARNGKPVATTVCANHTVLVYGHDQLRVDDSAGHAAGLAAPR